MSEGFVKFRLDGEVTIGKLSDACVRFARVLRALDESHDANVRWVLSGLDLGSAAVTARADPLDQQAERLIPLMCEDLYEAASHVAQGNIPSGSGRPVSARVFELAQVADANNNVVLEAASKQVTFAMALRSEGTDRQAKTTTSLGTVRGRVETLSHRKGLSFYLYELAGDKRVQCHPDPGYEDTMRRVWGGIADVTGTITRDAVTGQPTSIRDITAVDTIKEGDPLGYLQARGALRLREPAEQAVRRIRDVSR